MSQAWKDSWAPVYSQAAVGGMPAIQRLCEVHAPTLVVVGEKDLNDFHVTASLLVNNISGARQVMVPGAGHVLPQAHFSDLLG